MVSLQVDRLIELVTDLKASEVGREDTTALGKDFDSKLVFYKILLHDPTVRPFVLVLRDDVVDFRRPSVEQSSCRR